MNRNVGGQCMPKKQKEGALMAVMRQSGESIVYITKVKCTVTSSLHFVFIICAQNMCHACCKKVVTYNAAF